MEQILLHFSIKYKGDWDKIYRALELKEKVSIDALQNIEKKFQELKEKGYNYQTILSTQYPNDLKKAYKPPFVVFYKGDLKLLEKNTNTMISSSSHANPEEIVIQAKKLAEENTLVISKDEYRVRSELQKHSKIIVSNTGIQNDSINDSELLITETPLDIQEVSNETPRLFAALSSKLVLVSSSEETHNKLVNSFFNLAKDVEAFTRDASTEDWNNTLIHHGATPITSIKPVAQNNKLEELKQQAKSKQVKKTQKEHNQKLN